MTMRRQAFRSRDFLASDFLFSLAIVFCFSPSVANGNAGTSFPLVLGLILTGAVTFMMWRYHRRDYASPRRTWRRN
jgi:Na+-driven multidrug efflux pump